jgi:hypothetical protein
MKRIPTEIIVEDITYVVLFILFLYAWGIISMMAGN